MQKQKWKSLYFLAMILFTGIMISYYSSVTSPDIKALPAQQNTKSQGQQKAHAKNQTATKAQAQPQLSEQTQIQAPATQTPETQAQEEKLGLQTVDGNLIFLYQDLQTGNFEKIKDRKMTIKQKDYYFDENGNGVELSQKPLGSNEDGYYLTSNKYLLEIKDGIARIDGIIIVNKSFGVPEQYGQEIAQAKDTLTDSTRDAYYALLYSAKKENIYLHCISAYRSYLDQKITFEARLAQNGKEHAYALSAKPGHSEHQLGEAIDLNSLYQGFGNTAEGKWLNEHCWEFGFIIRYPNGKTDLTGYNYEPWHVRYVGKELAEKLYNNGDWLCIEEYFGLPSEYAE